MNEIKMNVKFWHLLIVQICLNTLNFGKSAAQIQPDFGPAFPQDQVTSIYINIDPDSIFEMYSNLETEHYYPATFTYSSSTLMQTVDTIGLQLRGNTSLNAIKKSFKIAFDAFDGSERWQSLKKLNLLAQHNDPSMLRSKICFDMYRHFGIPCARSSYTKLYINDEYFGLYLNVEQIDDEFAKLFFDNEGDGNLFKCTYPADLAYISNNPEAYKFANWGTRHYDLKTNSWKDDYRDLANFIDVLNNSSTNDMPCQLPKVFNLENYLKITAIDILTGNWDNHTYNKNNFYLYHHQQTDQFNYIPYDLDNTFGIDWINVDWSERNIYEWSPGGDTRPVYTRLMDNPEYRDRFSYHMDKTLTEYFNVEHITEVASYWQALIQQAIYDDPNYPLDYGYTPTDFDNAITDAWGNHVDFGIIPYVIARRSSALAQLETFEEQEAFVFWMAAKRIPGQVLIEAQLSGSAANGTSIRYSTDGINFTETDLTDNAGPFQIAGDGIYSFYDPTWPTTGDRFYFQIKFADNTLYPCEPAFFYTTTNNTGLFINEAMAVNQSTIFDEEMVYEDWLELYNNTNATIQLDGYFVSDDSTNWNKFPLPSYNLQSHAFALTWLDDDAEDGMWHSTFKLGQSENLFLTRVIEGVPRTCHILHSIPFLADQSRELTTDGGNTQANETNPTPGYSNLDSSVESHAAEGIKSWPNPANHVIQFSSIVNYAYLTDQTGRIIDETHSSNTLNTLSVNSGVYFLNLDGIIVKQIIIH